MEYRDYYQALGVPRSATAGEIKKAFRRLAREHHPDRNPGDQGAEQRFKDINEAHAVLSDAEKRRRYDMLGANWDTVRGGSGGGDPFGPGGPFAGASRGGGATGGVRYEFRTAGGGDAGFSDFFRTFFAGTAAGMGGASTASTRQRGGLTFEDILGDLGLDASAGARGGARTVARDRRQTELEAPAELGLEEAFHGTSRIVEIEGRRYEVTIPRGVDTGSRIRLSGKGPDARDVVVTVRMRPHPVFTRRGAHLERELSLTLREALLGAEVPVTTLKGRVVLTIPAGTQPGRTFRLAGQGMPRLKGDGAGDLLVRVRVVLPTHLDDEATAAARRFLDLAAQPDPRPAPTGTRSSRDPDHAA